MTDVQIRTAQVADLEDLGEVFRRSSLANDGDRAMLLANPEALEPNVVTSVHEARTRVAVVDDCIVGFTRWVRGRRDSRDAFRTSAAYASNPEERAVRAVSEMRERAPSS